MSNTISVIGFGDTLYDTLPETYRESDIDVDYALKRYLQCLADGGFTWLIEECNGILTLVDPDKIDANLLYILFKAYGLEIFNGIPELYLRKLLPSVSDLYSRKGSISSVEFITSIIAGVKVRVDTSRWDTEQIITIFLEMDYEAEGRSGLPRVDQLSRIIKEFLPFYIDAEVVYAYVFYEEALLIVDDSYNEFNVIYNYNELAMFDMLGDLSLLNKIDSEISDNFILDDRVDNSPTSADYTYDTSRGNLSVSSPLALNDSTLCDKIYVNGVLTQTIEY